MLDQILSKSELDHLARIASQSLGNTADARKTKFELLIRDFGDLYPFVERIDWTGSGTDCAGNLILALEQSGSGEHGPFLAQFLDAFAPEVLDFNQRTSLKALADRIRRQMLLDRIQAGLQDAETRDSLLAPRAWQSALRHCPALAAMEPLPDDYASYLLAMAGAPAVAGLDAFLKALAIPDRDNLVEQFRALRGVAPEALEEERKRPAAGVGKSPVIVVFLQPGERQAGSPGLRAAVRIRCYPPGQKEPLTQIEDTDSAGPVNPETFLGERLLKLAEALSAASDGTPLTRIRIEFIVPTELVGEPFDTWSYVSAPDASERVGRRFRVVVRWDQNLRPVRHIRLRSCALSVQFDWLSTPYDDPNSLTTRLEEFDIQEASEEPFPLSLLLCASTVRFCPTFWEQALQLGVALVWVRATEQEAEQVIRAEIEPWLSTLQSDYCHVELPLLIQKKRIAANPYQFRITLLWENPDHFPTPPESAARFAVSAQGRSAADSGALVSIT